LGGQLAGGALHGGADARVVGWEEADQRQQEVGGVWSSAAEGLGERAAGRRVDSGLLDLAADGARQRRPAVQVGGQAQAAGQADGSVDRDPGHDLGGDEVASAAADLPDAVVGLGPAAGNHVDGAGQQPPEGGGDGAAVAVIQPGGVEQVAVDVELELVGGVADPDRAGAAVAVQGVQLDLREQPFATHAVHELEVLGPAGGGAFQPAHEGMGLVGVAQGEQGVEVHGGIPQPAVAVVPVAHPAQLLGQGGGGGGHDGAGGGVGESLEDQGAACGRRWAAARPGRR